MAVPVILVSMAVPVVFFGVAVPVVTALLLLLRFSISALVLDILLQESLMFMDILITLESMRVGVILKTLHLDGSMVKVELSPAHVGDSGKGLEGGVRADMAG